jgi:4-amino-4-deoxy-L-arabinose transferase-like glycosyltransferase
MPEPAARAKSTFSASKALLLLVAVYVAINARWIWLYRQNNLLDIDEAGYLSMAFSYYRSLSGSGLGDWFKTVLSPGIQAPITPALASLLFWISTPSILTGFAVPLLAGVICVLSTYWLARCLMSAPAALWAAALVASCPLLTIFARSFHFSIPATALFTLSLVCMLRSRKFSSPLWASLFGVCMGLLPLTRTMTIAFLPGLVMGAAVHTVSQRQAILPRVGILIWSQFLAIITASIWLVGSASLVFGYLFNFGYGHQAAEYGSKNSLLSLKVWQDILETFLVNIYLPHTLLLFAGLLAACSLGIHALIRYGITDAVNNFARSSILPLLIILSEAILALASSQNRGSAFIAPIVPLAIVLSVWAVDSCFKARFSRAMSAFVGGVICLIATVPLADLMWASSEPWIVPLPGLGMSSIVTSGQSTIQKYERNGASGAYKDKDMGMNPGQPNSIQPHNATHQKDWLALIDQSSKVLRASPAAQKGGIAFGFRHHFVNPNTIRLSSLTHGTDLYKLFMIAPLETEESVAGYASWLQNKNAASACLLLTLSGEQGEFKPIVPDHLMYQAARMVGFVPTQHWMAPTGQKLQLWKRDLPGNVCR